MPVDPSVPKPARPDPATPAPWWRFAMVWFMLSGPALVVVAAFVTMAIAFDGADIELHTPGRADKTAAYASHAPSGVAR